MNNLVTYTRSGPIGNIVMDDGKVNVMSPRMLSEINRALDQAEADKVVVVLNGRAGVFSAGFDLTVLKAGGVESHKMVKGGFELAERLLAFPMPTVIVSTGHAIAMGVFLVLSGDVRLGAEGPYKYTANEVAIGLTVPYSAIEICRQRLAPAHFNRAVVLAAPFNPGEAVEAGFLDRAVPPAELQSTGQEVAAALTKLDMPSHKATKLRARANTLKAMRAAIEADDAEFRARYAIPA